MSGEKLAVLGAGTMGAQIAAHMANAGFEVLLLDIVPPGAGHRDILAETALRRLEKSDPPAFMSRRVVRRITPGNLEDDLPGLGDCAWVVEAVIEDAAVKRALYARLLPHLGPDTVVSSNTSILPLAVLSADMPEDFRRRFMITHFFNPPRYMRLLELVTGPATDPALADKVAAICDHRLGKSVVKSADRPGFVANRLGAFWIQCAIRFALELGLTVEEADAVMGRPLGFPKTGIFGLIDLVGLDLVPRVDDGLARALPPEDPYQEVRIELPILERLVAAGYTGRKGEGGFYRRRTVDGERIEEVVDLETGDYRPVRKVAFAALDLAKSGGIAALLEAPDEAAAYARAVLTRTLAYAARLVPEVTDSIEAVDRAMRTGYAWKRGPFELADRIGVARLVRHCETEGVEIPLLLERAREAGSFYRVEKGELEQLAPEGGFVPVVRPEGVILLEDVKRRGGRVAGTGSASLWDLGQGALCLEVHTKLNTIDPDVLEVIDRAVELVPADYRALVIYNEGEHFSAGANIGLALFAANLAAWPLLEEMVEKGQQSYTRLRDAPFPVVAAPSGLALGGACELLLVADRVVAHAESYVGLVECGVGLVPAWGGCARLMARYATDPRRPKGPIPPLAQAFETIGTAKVAKSAFEARELGFLAAEDPVVMNRDRLLYEAKRLALALADGYRPRPAVELPLPGPTGAAALGLALHDLDLKGVLAPHDKVVAGALAEVLSGGSDADHTQPVTEARVMELERAAFMRLIRLEPTLQRMEHTLRTGRPLRN